MVAHMCVGCKMDLTSVSRDCAIWELFSDDKLFCAPGFTHVCSHKQTQKLSVLTYCTDGPGEWRAHTYTHFLEWRHPQPSAGDKSYYSSTLHHTRERETRTRKKERCHWAVHHLFVKETKGRKMVRGKTERARETFHQLFPRTGVQSCECHNWKLFFFLSWARSNSFLQPSVSWKYPHCTALQEHCIIWKIPQHKYRVMYGVSG